MTRRRDKRIIPLCTGLFVALFAFVFLINRNNAENADAADLSKFDPGNIISDYMMSNYNSMTEAEIQQFLTSKNSCNNRDHNYYNQLSSANPNISWHWKDDHFVCLSEELFGDGMVIGEGKTAAKIIYETAQKYKINPQSLIVLIEKESGLITDPIPNSYDYRTMTGFGCPDTAPCDSKYFGFKNQLEKAAALFREVLDGGWTNYPLGENYIQYNPDRNCGGSIVNIKNLATSSLYRYTPYQPNAAALAAGRGTAHCGAYGNRNFYAYFSDWFGDPTAEPKKEPEELPKSQSDLEIEYGTYVQNNGWSNVSNGAMSGTTGQALMIEAVKISLKNLKGIEYKTYTSKGWDSDYKKDGQVSGVEKSGQKIEAIQIKFSDELASKYNIYYRAHIESIGWQDWVKNGETAGTIGQSKRIEAVEVKIVAKATVEYEAHVESIGWQDWVREGETAGTTGQSKRVESLKIKLFEDGVEKTIQYRAHVQEIGWQDWVKSNEIAGTIGQSKRIEALEIKLPEDMAKKYDIYYRAHVQGVGWQDWVKNGETAGTIGQSKRIEALEIMITAKTDLEYESHVQSVGWQDWVKSGKITGTTGQSKRIEAIKIKISEEDKEKDILYRTHVESIGWQDWVKNGETAGTTGQSKRIEAIEIKLPEDMAQKYDIYYRAHVQEIGWQDWVKNGETAGTTGQSRRIEALEIKLVIK